MAKKSLAAWKRKVLTGSYKVDLDNQSYDCVDVSKDWIVYLTGVRWQDSAGWGNAKDIYSFWHATYLDKIPRGNAPKLGDIVVMNGQVGGGYGHTGVIIAIDGRNIQIAQQNTFTQQAVYTGWFDAYATYITGFLRPNAKAPFSVEDAVELQPWQRKVAAGTGGVYYRKEPKKSGEAIELFKEGDVVDFKGWIEGESVDGNNKWFVGRHTGFYSWSGAYADTSTHDLVNMTPAAEPVLTHLQRKVGADAMNIRKTPKVDTVNNNFVALKQPGNVIDIKGYVIGQNVDGIDKWFVLTDGNYTWAGGYTNQDLSKLSNLTPVPPVDPVPTDPVPPVEPEPTLPDPLLTKVINKKHPIEPLSYVPTDLVDSGNGTRLRKEASEALSKMKAAAVIDGVTLTPQSGFRSFETQTTVYNNYVAKDGKEKADTYSARPGHSEHQTGLTMDFAPIEDSFANLPSFLWLTTHAYKYGFILRYPSDKTEITGYMYEPWHWRYIGVEEATKMRAQAMKTLEEFYNIPGGLYPDQDPPVVTPPADPETPGDPPEPAPPVPPAEAVWSGTKFLARITSQVVAARLFVEGVAAIVMSQTDLTLTDDFIGKASLALTAVIIIAGQIGYKLSGLQLRSDAGGIKTFFVNLAKKLKWPF